MALPNIVALDAGGATLKASVVVPYGSASAASGTDVSSARAPFVLANHVATLASAASSSAALIGQELLDKERQGAKLRYVRPVERGYCVNWNVETDIWSHLFSRKALDANPHEHAFVTTVPLFAPTVLHDTMDQVVFEEFGFQAFARVNAAEMSVLAYAAQCRESRRSANSSSSEPATVSASPAAKKRRRGKAPAAPAVADDLMSSDALAFDASSCHLVVDAGFSFTHVVPVVGGRALVSGVKRINVGGKLLTNYLKEIVSFRQWNVQDDTRVMNELKESLCYCALDFDAEMRALHAAPRRARPHWVLPDYVNSFTGRVQHPGSNSSGGGGDGHSDDHSEQQALVLGTELIAVPEVLFYPSDIGLSQAGVAEAVMQAVAACPRELHAPLLANVLLVGGSSKFRHFHTRLERDLRALVPSEFELCIHTPTDPILTAWDGCARFAASAACADRVVTKCEYDEHGSNICRKRF